MPRTTWMVGEILSEIEGSVKSLMLIPSGGGRFEWTVDGDVVYSKAETGRYPEMNELKELVYAKLS
ncbi:MAG TPA: Rdx family protein [Dehalococcoidia bacterium]|nr:Rdx family protein [Dehalococcoidia bacterium]